MEDEHLDDNTTPLPVSGVTLSPLLPGVLETAAVSVNNTEEVQHFLSYVIIHLLHCQPSPAVLSHLVQKWSHIVPSAVVNYINNWSPDNIPKPLKKQFGSHSIESKLSKTLLSEDEIESVNQILGLVVEEGEGIKSKNLGNLKIQDPVHILLLYKLAVYHMVQLASHGGFTEQLRDKCKEALLSLLQIMSDLENKQDDDTNMALSNELFNLIQEKHLRLLCLKYTLTHPFLLQKFTPISGKKQVIEKLITETILDLIKLSSISKKDLLELHVFLKPFKHKLINSVFKRLKKCRKNKVSWLSAENIVSVIELFELDFPDVENLLSEIVKIPIEALIFKTEDSLNLSTWGNMLAHLLNCCIQMHKPLKSGIVSSIVHQMTQLAKEKQLDILLLQDNFCQYLECFPHHIEHLTTSKYCILISHFCVHLLPTPFTSVICPSMAS